MLNSILAGLSLSRHPAHHPPLCHGGPDRALRLGFEVRDNLAVLIFTYLAQTLPVALYMLANYFRTIPDEIEQAGLIDGCTRLGVIWRITMPLAIPALVSVLIYTFMIAWNEYLYAFVFLNEPRHVHHAHHHQPHL